MNPLIASANDLIWGSILVYLLLGAGIYFTLRTGVIQFRRLGFSFRALLGSRQTTGNGISSFQAFCTSLAARVGTGNLAGVAMALYLGGPGAIFWMWVIALLGMSSSLMENTLAQLYKTSNGDGTFRGGPSYYIEKALGQRWLGITFSICLIIAFGLAFNSVQSNSIAAAMHNAFDVTPWVSGVLVAIVTTLIVFGGIRSISRFAEIVVPFMALAYIAVALFIVITHLSEMPAVFRLIFDSAFGIGSAAAGGTGYLVSQAIMQGVKRGLFSNEAGMGSAPNAAATATPNPPHPVTQGIIGMAGVFIDTIVICTATAAIVLVSGQLESGSGLQGIALTQNALSSLVGSWGSDFIAIAILLFAFTSIIANYYYGESNLRFIIDRQWAVVIYRLAVLGMVIYGAIASLPVVWSLADLSMGMMAIINVIALLLLSGIVFRVIKDFEQQVDRGEIPCFDRRKFEFLDRTLDADVWDKTPEEAREALTNEQDADASETSPARQS
ncbi:sodium:alanine symporter family protein [Aestuariirhabdus sp. Z084]|uniref:alanine/glycine:cation symporter family protein n=1 Tax=Aestuariirhabdus haliotis TaxID=2918751 RepID=UPI00201B3A13|nr:sodium:alanine symporter family protein [Aestuariirhabdus haliotis]MCL6415177.1 sodium:alanine symporter family protein [Aestuariirhabdus haliotis]MCL6420052.1 sodium:alanine symporter family protein [Aestuariirhabdus haliotis]